MCPIIVVNADLLNMQNEESLFISYMIFLFLQYNTPSRTLLKNLIDLIYTYNGYKRKIRPFHHTYTGIRDIL